jgi:uncharacterized protein YecT (DUF1311 family)
MAIGLLLCGIPLALAAEDCGTIRADLKEAIAAIGEPEFDGDNHAEIRDAWEARTQASAAAADRAAEQLGAGLDVQGRALLDAAIRAWRAAKAAIPAGDAAVQGEDGRDSAYLFIPEEHCAYESQLFDALCGLRDVTESRTGLAREDDRLNAAFKRIKAASASSNSDGFQSFVNGQRAWLRLRDAWVGLLAHVRGDSAHLSLAVGLTGARADHLEEIADALERR